MQTNTTPTEIILSVQNLTVSFDGFKALDGLDFAMADGELRFVIGPNGAGKTTLLDVVTGKTRPQQGAVTFNGGLNVLRTPEHQLVQKGIGRKFQTPTIFGSLTVFENLEAAAGFNDGIVRVFGRVSADDRAKIEQTLELIGLHGRAHVRAGILAHGEKQWLEIGMLLVQEPRLLLLDEPVAGMTRQERNRTGELLQAIAQRCSVLVVEHDMEFMRSFATTVSVLHMGKLLCQGSVQTVQNDPRVIEVYLGRSHQQH
ncbi:MAG: urea ABC transporter ATP-binding protein UrtD [Caldilineaceae bacterium]|nr:urea ABC transporter ATP-binding protein UrtD [Caldilineaceae bacterium]